MRDWHSFLTRGRRASDQGATAPANPVRDWLLATAISREQVEVLFQPLIEPKTGVVRSVEALARSPLARSAGELFERAGRAGLSERVSRLVQRKALRAASSWEGPLQRLNLALNLLPQEISRPGYDQWLLDEICASGLEPSRITIEITESALLTEQDDVIARLNRLRAAGVRVALDDFGTGYASLAYLTALPLDVIKLDRGLIQNIVDGERDRIVVKAMIQLARELDLKVVVEGVESAAQLALLKEWGCDLYQGFFGASALSHDELVGFVMRSHQKAA